MKKINLLLFFLLLACALPAQDGISVFIGRANRYASVELSDYRKRLCLEYNISNHSLDDYYRRCGNDWGNVGIALEIARTSGKKKCVMYATITSGIIVTGGTVSLWRLA